MRLRVGVLGLEHVHTTSYIHEINNMPDIELVGVYGEQSRLQFWQSQGIPTYANLDDLLAEKLQAVSSLLQITYRIAF